MSDEERDKGCREHDDEHVAAREAAVGSELTRISGGVDPGALGLCPTCLTEGVLGVGDRRDAVRVRLGPRRLGSVADAEALVDAS